MTRHFSWKRQNCWLENWTASNETNFK